MKCQKVFRSSVSRTWSVNKPGKGVKEVSHSWTLLYLECKISARKWQTSGHFWSTWEYHQKLLQTDAWYKVHLKRKWKKISSSHFTGCKLQKAYTSLGTCCHNAYTRFQFIHRCFHHNLTSYNYAWASNNWNLEYTFRQEVPKLAHAFCTLQPVILIY